MHKRELSLSNLIGGNRGSIELASVFILFATFTLCLFINQRLSLWSQEVDQRINSLICFKSIMDAHATIFNRIKLSNKVVATAHATFLATANPISLKVKKATQIGQKILIAIYLSKILLVRKCKISQRTILAYLSPIRKPIRRDLVGRVEFHKRKRTLIFPLTFRPIHRVFLKGFVHSDSTFTFSNAQEWSFR